MIIQKYKTSENITIVCKIMKDGKIRWGYEDDDGIVGYFKTVHIAIRAFHNKRHKIMNGV